MPTARSYSNDSWKFILKEVSKHSYYYPKQKGMPRNIPVHSNIYIFVSVHTAGKKASLNNTVLASSRAEKANQRPKRKVWCFPIMFKLILFRSHVPRFQERIMKICSQMGTTGLNGLIQRWSHFQPLRSCGCSQIYKQTPTSVKLNGWQ
jgi:hypothetical protein